MFAFCFHGWAIVQLYHTDCASALQNIDVSHWQNDLINGYHLGFKVQYNTSLFYGFGTKYQE